jgi:hypothetical protein
MESVIFRCAHCGLPLTEPLAELTEGSEHNYTDASDLLPSGFYFIAGLTEDKYGWWPNSADNYLVNLKDIRNTKHHHDSRRLNGCCGLDGRDGRNLLCANDHEVGTGHSDCWMPHFAAFDPATVLPSG